MHDDSHQGSTSLPPARYIHVQGGPLGSSIPTRDYKPSNQRAPRAQFCHPGGAFHISGAAPVLHGRQLPPPQIRSKFKMQRMYHTD